MRSSSGPVGCSAPCTERTEPASDGAVAGAKRTPMSAAAASTPFAHTPARIADGASCARQRALHRRDDVPRRGEPQHRGRDQEESRLLVGMERERRESDDDGDQQRPHRGRRAADPRQGRDRRRHHGHPDQRSRVVLLDEHARIEEQTGSARQRRTRASVLDEVDEVAQVRRQQEPHRRPESRSSTAARGGARRASAPSVATAPTSAEAATPRAPAR